MKYGKYFVFKYNEIFLLQGGLSTSAMVKILVEDINDNAPKFSPEVYNVTLTQDHPTSRSFLILNAEDEDSGSLGEVKYRIDSGNDLGVFSLDPVTGELSLYSGLDKFPLFYQMEIEAEDMSGKRGQRKARVNIHVTLDTRDLPVFEQQIYTFSVSEGASPFSKIGRVLPSNQNNARLFLYPEHLKSLFDLNPRTGELSTRTSLDHETRSQFLLNIGAVSTSGHIGYTQVVIHVTDVNDNKPEFQPSLGMVSIPENSPVNTVVSAHTATDADSGLNGQVRYRLVRDPGHHFTIDEDTGVLRTNKVSHIYKIFY